MTIQSWHSPMTKYALLSAVCLAFAQQPAWATDTVATPAVAPVAEQAATADTHFRQTVDEFFIRDAALNPLYAPAKEVNQYNARFGDYLSDDYLAAQKALEQQYLALVQKMDRKALNAENQLSYDAFIYARETAIKGFDFPSQYLPLTQEVNKVSDLAMQASGDLVFPFETVKDYEDFAARMSDFSHWADLAIERMKQGSAKGIAQPRPVVDATVELMRGLVSSKVKESKFYSPVQRFPKTISAADRVRLEKLYRKTVQTEVTPAIQRLVNYMSTQYKPREGLGWKDLPNGSAWYQYLSDAQTSTNLSVDTIAQRGEAEVERIYRQMNEAKEAAGFKGSLKDFMQDLSTNKKYQWTQRAKQMAAFKAIDQRLDDSIPKLFNHLPRTKLEIKPVPPEREEIDGAAWYSAGTADASKPGVFFVNTKPGLGLYTWEMESNYVHEARPGHHFQISLKQEQQNVPQFRKFAEINGFEEGWALYVESICQELALCQDPLQRFGQLNNEMLRAMRLVVETGLHTRNWSLDQAKKYMADHSALSKDYIDYEVVRYLANPGQALSYKVGQLSISDMRAQAKQKMGANFDVRSFHDQVISTGTLPLAVLEHKIHRWADASNPH